MRRFLALWVVLSLVGLVVATLGSWLVLSRIDLTYEIFVSWMVIPPVQALAVQAATRGNVTAPRSAPVLPAGLRALPYAAALAGFLVALLGVVRPLHPVFGFADVTSRQHAITRVVAALAGAAFLALSIRRTRPRLAPLGALLAALGLDLPFPWLSSLPFKLLPGRGRLVPWVVTYGLLVAAGFAFGLLAASAARDPLARRLLDAALASAFVAVHVTLLNFFLHPWFTRPWDAAVPALFSLSASLAFAAAVGLALGPRGETA